MTANGREGAYCEVEMVSGAGYGGQKRKLFVRVYEQDTEVVHLFKNPCRWNPEDVAESMGGVVYRSPNMAGVELRRAMSSNPDALSNSFNCSAREGFTIGGVTAKRIIARHGRIKDHFDVTFDFPLIEFPASNTREQTGGVPSQAIEAGVEARVEAEAEAEAEAAAEAAAEDCVGETFSEAAGEAVDEDGCAHKSSSLPCTPCLEMPPLGDFIDGIEEHLGCGGSMGKNVFSRLDRLETALGMQQSNANIFDRARAIHAVVVREKL